MLAKRPYKVPKESYGVQLCIIMNKSYNIQAQEQKTDHC